MSTCNQLDLQNTRISMDYAQKSLRSLIWVESMLFEFLKLNANLTMSRVRDITDSWRYFVADQVPCKEKNLLNATYLKGPWLHLVEVR